MPSLKPIAALPSPDPEPEEKKEKDPRYFYLSRPLKVGEKTFDRLLIDPSELSGKDFFNLTSRFRSEYPDIYRTSVSKLHEDIFVSMIVSKLNPPCAAEDLQKLSFKDVPLLILRVQGSLFSTPDEDSEKDSEKE